MKDKNAWLAPTISRAWLAPTISFLCRSAMLFLSAFSLAMLAGFMPVHADIADRPDVGAFIREASRRNHLNAAGLYKLFRQVEIQHYILDMMARPAESKPWLEYRRMMVNEDRILGGMEFWKRNRASLEEASSRYGVAAEIIVAILGVETRYGKVLGNFRVIDALSTLAFEYPRRADFFRKELEEFLLLCREENIDPSLLRGSYTGAMGIPQFMPSSFRQYATDLDGDHKRNIWSNPADAIASVANYFSRSGWRKGEAVAVQAKVSGEGFHALLERAVKIDYSIAQLRGLGVEALASLSDSSRARLTVFAVETGPEYWLALPNFFVITQYNQSLSYAMAVSQLGKEILARRDGV